MSSYLKVFNEKLVEFIKDLLILFPNDRDLKKAKMGLDMLIPNNPRGALTLFKQKILPHKELVLSMDIDKILEKGRAELGEQLGPIFDKISKDYKEMSDTNRENVTKYCKLLIMLAEKC